MKRTASLLGLVLLGLASQAHAIDVVKLRNTTDRTLPYKMQCADPATEWKLFSTPPHDHSEITARYCKRFGFEMTSKSRDGSVVTVKYSLEPNSWYRLVYNRDKDRWDLTKVRRTDF